MKKYLLPLFCLIFFSIGCYEDTDNTPAPEVIIETSEIFVNTSISGSVLDLEGNFISDYNLMVNDKLNTIPADYFLLQLEDLKKKGQTIHVIKDDKQIGIRTQLLVENDINHIEIQQHEEYKQKTPSSSNSKIDIAKSLIADFSATKWENDYAGQIVIDYVNIESNNSITPVGYSSISDLLAIDSRGGFYLNAKTENGDDIVAQKEFPIVINTSDLDEDVNSLFVFNKKDEIWVLVTELTSGDEVEILGEGYYTFAHYVPGVFVEGIVTKESKPVSYQPMNWDLASQSNQIRATEKGRWIALLPEQETVKVNLLNPCDESLQTETLDIEVIDIKDQNLIVADSDNYQQLNMTILDCFGEVVSAPNLNISNGDETVHYVFSEEYPDRWIAVCDNFSIAAVNETTGENGPGLSWSTDIVGGLDVMTNCNDYEAGFSFIKIRGEEKVYPAFELESNGEQTILKSTEGNVKFIFKGSQERMYDVDEVNVLIDDEEFGEKGYYVKCENSAFGCGINSFNVTHYEEDGNGIVRASFSGTMWMQTLSPSVAGNFDIEGVIVIKL